MLAMPSWIRFALNVLIWYLGSVKKLYASWKTKSKFLLTYSSHFIKIHLSTQVKKARMVRAQGKAIATELKKDAES